MELADTHDSRSTRCELTMERIRFIPDKPTPGDTDPLQSLATLFHTDIDAVDCIVRRASKNHEDNVLKYVRKKDFVLARVFLAQVLGKEV